MRMLLALLPAIALGLGVSAETAQADPPKTADPKQEPAKLPEEKKAESSEDPLPKGSTLRFGTSRFRAGTPITRMLLSADGRMAIVSGGSRWGGFPGFAESEGNHHRVFDLSSGRELYSIASRDESGESIEAIAISPDGKMIVSKQGIPRMSLCVYDSANGKELRKIRLPRTNNFFNSNNVLAFTPDGKAIAVTTEGNVVHLIDFGSGKTIHGLTHSEPVSAVAFSPDGKVMAASGGDHQKAAFFVALWDVKTGKELHKISLGKREYFDALAFSPDGKTVAGGSLGTQFRFWDVETGKAAAGFPKGDAYGTHEIAFAPDGKTLALAGMDAIHLYDLASKKERLRISSNAIGMQFTDGGKTLTAAVLGAIVKWDAATGKVLTPDAAGESEVSQILATNDGKKVISCGLHGDFHIWDGSSGKHLKGLKFSSQARYEPFGDSTQGLAMSPDSRFLVWAVAEKSIRFKDDGPFRNWGTGSRIRLYDIAADKFVDRFPGFKGDAHQLTFAENGKKLVSIDHSRGMVRLWNVETGKEERNFAILTAAERQTDQVARTALSADCKSLAVVYETSPFLGGGNDEESRRVQLWDVASGKKQADLYGHMRDVLDMSFSPDGRFLVTAGEKHTDMNDLAPGAKPKTIAQVFVWDAATGKRVETMPAGFPAGACAVSFSRDGRFLATALPEGSIRLWEIDTWTVWNEFKESHRDKPSALTFTPGGQLLSGSQDTTVLVWDLRPPRLTTGSLDTAWTDLAKLDSGESFKAEGRFAGAGADAIKYFAEHIKPTEPPDAIRIHRWLTDLDHKRYVVREAASRNLSDIGRHARPYLEEVVKNSSSPEVIDRAQKLLAQPIKMTPDELREFRAIMVLELINNDEAKDLLKKWTVGFKSAVLTQESRAALSRMETMTMAKR